MAQTTASANGPVSRASSLLRRGFRLMTGRRRAENRPSRPQDRRLNHRLKVHFEAKISSESGSMQVRGVNIHSDGALVVAKEPLAPKSVVFVQLTSFGLIGFGQVQHCTGRGESSYAIGLAFPTPLMKEELGTWEFHRVRQTDSGWSAEWEASMNFSTPLRAV